MKNEWIKNYLAQAKAKYTTYEEMINICTDRNLILNNSIIEEYNKHYYDLEVFCGSDYDEDEDEYTEVFQYFIITESSAEFIANYTDELVYYLPEFDMYLLGVTHFGTPWSSVSANWKTI